MLISELMADELKREAAMTRKLLERIPADKLDWSAGHGLKSISWNASHLAEIPGWVAGVLEEDGMDLAKFEGQPLATTNPEIATILKTFDTGVAQAISALAGVPDAKMNDTWTMKMNGHEIFTMKKGDCLRKWVFTHTAHHRGILSIYLKMVGVKFSSIYEE